MNLQRLRRMDLGEIAVRSRMEASKWLDRMGPSAPRRSPLWSGTASGPWREAFREGSPRRFFAGAVDERTPALLARRVPEAVRDVLAGAEQAVTSRFDLLGYRALSFGDPVDWHLDPVSRRRAPLAHWSRLDPLDTAAVGDNKVVWELNRHQWLVALGQAYHTTRDETYADAFAAQVGAWLEANPRGHGINWTSSLEVALRLVAWCWALVLLRRSPALSPRLFARMSASIEEHATHVERYLSHYFSPNTHLTGEALGLFYAGVVFPEMPAARRWRERGAGILVDEIARQVLPDGVYFEQSTCYQRYTVEIALHFLVLSARNRLPVPAVVGERLQAMLDFLLAVRSPGGRSPQIGDADGGWLLPLARRAPDDLRGVFGIGAALFARADYAWASGGIVPEVLWLLGAAGVDALDSLRAEPPRTAASRLFPDGGYAVMRDGWGEDAHQLLFDVGPLGCPATGGHGHADLLSIQCSPFGLPFIVDPGTGTYADEVWRTYFRSTAAHSTVTVDGAGQAVSAGPFVWRHRPRARLRQWRSTESYDFADAEHDAYLRMPDPVRHRRRVLFVKPRYWVVLDELEGAEAHRVELRFQFGPVTVEREAGSWVRATAGGRGLLLCAFAAVPLSTRVSRGNRQPMEGWFSPEYGQCRPAPVVVYSASASLPLRIVTLLLPSADPSASPPDVSPLRHDDASVVGLVIEGGRETVSLEGAEGRLVHSFRSDRHS